MQSRLEQVAPQSTQKNINLEILSNLQIPVPSIELQQKFTQSTQQFERLRAQQREAEHLFQTLLHQAFEASVGLGSGISREGDVEDGIQASVDDSELRGDFVQLQMKC